MASPPALPAPVPVVVLTTVETKTAASETVQDEKTSLPTPPAPTPTAPALASTPTLTPASLPTSPWSALHVAETERRALADMKMVAPSPVQQAVLSRPHPAPAHLLVVQAPSGTGKTVAYLLALARILDEKQNHTQAIVVLPTRELVLQSVAVANKLFAYRKLVAAPALPDSPRNTVLAAHIVFGPPKTLVSKLKFKELLAARVDSVVWDEADFLLRDFASDLQDIASHLQKAGATPRVLAMSATWPESVRPRINAMFGSGHGQSPSVDHITVERENKQTFADGMAQYLLQTSDEKDKRVQIREMLNGVTHGGSTIAFFQRGKDAEELAKELVAEGFSVASLFAGNMTPAQRDATMKNFVDRKCTVLLTTNLLGRGIDIDHVTYVINVDLPYVYDGHKQTTMLDEDMYLHRVGRTGRFGKPGMALTMVSSAAELDKLRAIEAKWKASITKIPRPSEKIDEFNEAVKRVLSMKK